MQSKLTSNIARNALLVTIKHISNFVDFETKI
jgi:hypothetical protein